MEAAAAVTAFVGLALTSANGIYKAISGFKNAPLTIQQLSVSVVTLTGLLTQLKDCKDALALATDLPDIIVRCAEDLRDVETKLAMVATKPNSVTQRIKINVTVVLQEHEWEGRLAMIQRHHAALSTQLAVITEYEETCESCLQSY